MIDSPTTFLPHIDETGNTIGKITRKEAHSGSRLLHPVVHLHVFNPKGELYLQRRPLWKDIQPGKWDTAVGGHVDFGESIQEALMRETFEEIGIRNFITQSLGCYIFDSKREREMVYVHSTIYCEEIHPDQEELDGGRFWSRQEIMDNIGKGILTPNFEQEYLKFFSGLNSFKQ